MSWLHLHVASRRWQHILKVWEGHTKLEKSYLKCFFLFWVDYSVEPSMLPGWVGSKSIALLCTRSGWGRTRSMISWSLELWNLDWSVESMALGLGDEVRRPSTSSTPRLLAVGCWSLSSRLSSSESIVFSKNWRHSCSSRLRKCSPSSSCQDQEAEETVCDIFICWTFTHFTRCSFKWEFLFISFLS